MKQTQFELTSTQIVYTNNWISVSEDRVIRPDGQPGIFGVVTMREGVSVLAYDTSGNVTLVNEFKYAIGRHTVEAVSGGMDQGELPLETAKRELEEELGLIARKWTYLGLIDPFTSVIKSPNHLFLAENLIKGKTNPDSGEVVEPLKMPLATAVEMVLESKITHGATCTLILKAERLIKQRK
jgi:ADP-ribose pyrophosphatase